MILYPSIDRLLEKIDSKYTLVSVSAKRARELQNEAALMIDKTHSHNFVGKALEEVNEGVLYFHKSTEPERRDR